MSEEKEHFKILKEINSLMASSKELDKELASEQLRISRIQTQISDKQNELSLIEQNFSTQSTLARTNDLELDISIKKLNQMESNTKNVSSEHDIASMEKELTHLKSSITAMEELAFTYLESIEELEENKKGIITFLKGASESLSEISEEVLANINVLQAKIDNLNNRITLLTEQLPMDFQAKLKTLFSKKINLSYFSRIINNKCEFCMSGLDRMFVIDVEDKFKVKTCPACQRLMLPQQSSY